MTYRVVHLLDQRRTVIEEDPVEIPLLPRWRLEMRHRPAMCKFRSTISVVAALRLNTSKALDEVAAIDQHCGRHHLASIVASRRKKPSVWPSLDGMRGLLGGLDAFDSAQLRYR
ncbi:hypothetical protein D9M71_762530 [compost metagenome]